MKNHHPKNKMPPGGKSLPPLPLVPESLPSLPIKEDDDALLDTSASATLLDVSHQWLELARSKGFGPPYVKVTKRLVKYRRGDLRKYMHERTHVPQKEDVR